MKSINENYKKISFESKILDIGNMNIIKIPAILSEELPSRGMVMAQVTINTTPFVLALEPDGKRSHWFQITDNMSIKTNVKVGGIVLLTIQDLKDWKEPKLPIDIINALNKANLNEEWNAISSKAKWDWLRWIRSTKNPETRINRINVACNKLEKGEKRPCCFNRTQCTITQVSKGGILIESS